MKTLVWLIFLFSIANITYSKTVITEFKKNDFVLGGYFGVHRPGIEEKGCGPIDQDSGIYLVEAMKYAINKINKNASIQLGYRIVDTCSKIGNLRDNLVQVILDRQSVGVIGPATSAEAVFAAPTFDIFRISMISYSATGIDLGDERYSNFYRTLPTDDVQAEAIRDILIKFNWTFISTVNSYGDYGQNGMNYLISLFPSARICISTRNSLPKFPVKADYNRAVNNLRRDKNAKVVVLFTTAEDTRQLMLAANSQDNFTWLSSSAWTADYETTKNLNEVAKGALILSYDGINNNDFREYFLGLKQYSNNYGWFNEFWEDTFNCTIRQKLNSTKRVCTGNESLSNSSFYGKYGSAGAVIDAVNVYAYAIHCSVKYVCRQLTGINKTNCRNGLSRYDIGNALKYYMKLRTTGGLKCSDIFNRVKFDINRTYYRDIEILNFDGKKYKKVGLWKRNFATNITVKNIVWSNEIQRIPESVCSKPCRIGERMVKSLTRDCCFTCHGCKDNEILVNNSCFACKILQVPNANRYSCQDILKMKPIIKHPFSISVFVESVIGIILNTIVLLLFIKHRNSKIVKSSSRELSFFMLAGLYLCFFSPILFLLQPTVIRCGLTRFMLGISLTACYTPLMLKTNRIYRIFKAARTMVSMPYLVSPQSLTLICFGLLALQLSLSILWLVGDAPVVNHVIVKEYNMVADLCAGGIFNIIVNLIPGFCMLGISTFFAFKTRKFPKNFNEAFNIGVTMYVSCVLWTIFIPLLLWVKIESTNPFAQNFVIATFSNLIGLISLAGLFGPKVRRLLLHKKEDTSQAMFSSVYKNNSVNLGLDNSIDLSTVDVLDFEQKVANIFERNESLESEDCSKIRKRSNTI